MHTSEDVYGIKKMTKPVHFLLAPGFVKNKQKGSPLEPPFNSY